MTAPMLDQQAPVQPMQPPQPPFSPFPIRPNDGEPQVATIYAKRLSKLMVDPKFAAQPVEWQSTAVEAYQRSVGALQAVQAAQQAAAQPQPRPAKPIEEP